MSIPRRGMLGCAAVREVSMGDGGEERRVMSERDRKTSESASLQSVARRKEYRSELWHECTHASSLVRDKRASERVRCWPGREMHWDRYPVGLPGETSTHSHGLNSRVEPNTHDMTSHPPPQASQHQLDTPALPLLDAGCGRSYVHGASCGSRSDQ